MTVTATETVNSIVTDALRKIGVVAIGSAATADEYRTATRALNRMLKSWQNRGYNLWLVGSQTVTLTTAASYTLSPIRPFKIYSVRLTRSGIETPMQEMTRDEYDNLPLKTATGLPTCWYYDRQREAALLYVWPVLSAANGETLSITHEREVEDIDTTTTVLDVPAEWYDAVVYGLAARLTDDFMVNAPNVIGRASEELRLALAADREGSVFFAGEEYA